MVATKIYSSETDINTSMTTGGVARDTFDGCFNGYVTNRKRQISSSGAAMNLHPSTRTNNPNRVNQCTI